METDQNRERLHDLVDHLFRHQAGRLVATLTGIFGPQNLDLAEGVVQESLLEALRRWPLGGIPENPTGWLFRVARNRALDRLRRRGSFDRKKNDVVSLMETRLESLPEATFSDEISDDQLRLIFTCCHPALGPDARIALTLKTVCGFSVAEIAAAFLTSEPTVAQRITRAKRHIAERQLPYAVPPPTELADRLNSVLKVLYLMFNEGYSPMDGDAVVRMDICKDAVRLAELVATHPVAGRPESSALAALLLLQGARLDTRQDADGEILLLEDQDRSCWNRQWIDRGLHHLREAMAAPSLTPYHLEAGIAACHAAAPRWVDTDWSAILGYYDQLIAISPSPITELNRSVALLMVEGPGPALDAVSRIENARELAGSYLLWTAKGEICHRKGDFDGARTALLAALDRARATPVQRFLQRRLRDLRWPPHGTRGAASRDLRC